MGVNTYTPHPAEFGQSHGDSSRASGEGGIEQTSRTYLVEGREIGLPRDGEERIVANIVVCQNPGPEKQIESDNANSC